MILDSKQLKKIKYLMTEQLKKEKKGFVFKNCFVINCFVKKNKCLMTLIYEGHAVNQKNT